MHDNGCYVKLTRIDHETIHPPTSAPDQKNSPSRSPFRPPLSLTFPLRVLPSNSASTYSGSVLGASGNLGAGQGLFKGRETRRGRNLRKFNFPHFHSDPCSLWITSPPLPQIESGRAPSPTAGDLARCDLLHLGPPLRPLHLAGRPRRRRLGRDRVRLRSRLRLPDLPSCDHVRRGRPAASGVPAGAPGALSPDQREEQQPGELRADLVPQALGARLAPAVLLALGKGGEQQLEASRTAVVEGGAHLPEVSVRARPASSLPGGRDLACHGGASRSGRQAHQSSPARARRRPARRSVRPGVQPLLPQASRRRVAYARRGRTRPAPTCRR
jgi:hypothetical protein